MEKLLENQNKLVNSSVAESQIKPQCDTAADVCGTVGMVLIRRTWLTPTTLSKSHTCQILRICIVKRKQSALWKPRMASVIGLFCFNLLSQRSSSSVSNHNVNILFLRLNLYRAFILAGIFDSKKKKSHKQSVNKLAERRSREKN